MRTGPGNVKIPPGCTLVIRASKKFTALGLDKDKTLKAILGPAAEQDRLLRRVIPPGIIWLDMRISKAAHWTYETVDRHEAEHPDLTPVEIPVNLPNLSYEDEMRRIVRDELSRAAESAHKETFDEADDFNIQEDSEDPSQYEMSPMQEDQEYVQKVSDDPAIPKDQPEKTETPHRPVGDPPDDPEKQPPAAPETPPSS